MAPPSGNTLSERLLVLAQTLQFAWFGGHVTLILCTLRYALSWIFMNYYSRMAQFSYRTAFLAAALTYGIVVYKTFKGHAKNGSLLPGGAIGVLSDENVQYLGLALVWLLLPQYALALLPYFIYSVFHVATYTRAQLIPAIASPKPVGTPSAGAKAQAAPNPYAEKIGLFVKEYYDSSMSVVSVLEIALWFRIFLSALFFQSRSWLLIGIYTLFLRARYAQSAHVRTSFQLLETRVDNLVGSQGTPPVVSQVWTTIKGGVRQFYTYTDISKHASGATAPKKTS